LPGTLHRDVEGMGNYFGYDWRERAQMREKGGEIASFKSVLSVG
jgi:hypothetical protein